MMKSVSNHRIFGFWTSTSLVIGNMIGTGIFFLPANLGAIGSISIIGWLVTAFGAMCLAFVFSRLSLVYPKSGGPYTHSRDVFGNFIGFQMGWGYWIMGWTSNAAVSFAFVSYLSLFFPVLAQNRIINFIASITVLWIATVVNCIGLRVGGRVQVITTFLKLSPLIIVPLVGLFFIDSSLYFPTHKPDVSPFQGISSAFALTLWAFIGLESATVPADRVQDPGRTISRATLFGTALVALVYLSTTIVLFGLIPANVLATSHAPFVDAAILIFGSWVGPLIGLCILISIYGGLNGWVLMQGQVPHSMAQEGLFPKIFAKESRDGTPVFGLIVSSIAASILMFLTLNKTMAEQVKMVVEVGSVMTIFAYLFSALSTYKLFNNSSKNKYAKLTLGLHIAILGGILYSLFAIYGADKQTLIYVGIGFLLGIPVYTWGQKDAQKALL
ncbi:MAG: amino acid permease [Alphaproteobacteria bacterium]|nr:amino acid permease [Alphaproteobacteria bacterium]